MFLQVKKNKRKLIEKIEKIQAERKPFMLERLAFKQKKTQKAEMISSFINKLDNNWKMVILIFLLLLDYFFVFKPKLLKIIDSNFLINLNL